MTPPESTEDAALEPAAGALAALAGAVLSRWLWGRPLDGPLCPRSVQVGMESIEIEIDVTGPGKISLGRHRLRFEILTVEAARSEWRWSWVEAGRWGRLASHGLRLLPPEIMDKAVRRILGAGVQVRGDQLALDHGALVARARQQESPDGAGTTG